MNEIAKLMIRSGVLTEQQKTLFQKWGMDMETTEPSIDDAMVFMKEMERALQDKDYVLVRETDFNTLRSYLSNQRMGKLHLVSDTSESDIDISYAVMPTGEYVMPWNGDTVADLLANGKTFLWTDDGEVEHFVEVRELYYGEVKAFVACRPLPRAESKALPADPDATLKP